MEESVILHRLESRLAGHKIQAIEELIGIVRNSGKLHFNNKLSLFSSFKRILQDEDLQLRTKCTKLICDVLPKLGNDMDTCMSFVIPNILANMAANNLVLKRESIKLVRCFSEITGDKNALVRSVIWEGIDSKDSAVSREVILGLDKLIFNILQTEDCYNIVTALCKRYYVEDNKKVKKAIRDSFSAITGVISLLRMEELITQLPSSAVTSGRELLQSYKQTDKQTDKQKITSYKSSTKLEVDSAISLETKLLWDLIPDSTLTKLHGDDVVEQLKAVAELESAIRRVTAPADFLICIEEICEAIIKVIPINNFRVFKASTVLVSAFVEVFRDVLGDCVYPLTRALCHKIGDNKIAVREGTMKCLTQLMKVCGPRPVLDVVLVNLRDRNPRVREEAINVVIKTLLTFPIQDIDISTVAEYLVSALGDHRQRVVNTALEAIAVLKERISSREVGVIYRAVEKMDTPDKRYLHAIKDRLEKGTMSTLNDVGLVTHGEGCFSRNGTTLTGGSVSRMSNQSVSVPTTSQERMLSKDGTVCPPTPLSLPRRYYSAGRNRLPWERPSRQNTLFLNNQGAEEQFTSPRAERGHVFIKGGGGRSDGGSYAQMHLKKMQMEAGASDDASHSNAPRSNTLGSLKKYFPSVKGSPDPKRSWPTAKSKDDEVLSNGSAPPQKSNSFANDSYGVQTSSMYANYRVNSGESSGVGTLTNNTPNGSASNPPRQTHYSPATTLNDSGIFEEHSFVNSKRSTPVTTEEHRTTQQVPEDTGNTQNIEARSAARREIRQEEEGRRFEEERLENAKWEKIRMEELAKEEKRRSQLRAQIQRENELAEQHHREESMRIDSYHIGNGYVELTSQNLAKKKLKQAAEESRKPRPKLIKARTRTESISNEPDTNIDIVGKGLSSHHIDLEGGYKGQVRDKPKVSEEKQQLRAPSGVYGQRVHPSRSPDEVDGSLSDNSEEDSSDKEERTNRDGHPIGSGLSAATRMRFEKKRAQYVERQSAEQRPEDEEEEVYKKPSIRAQYGKPVSAPVESRLNVSDGAVKRSPSKPHVRAGSLRPHDTAESDPVDEKENVPLINPESSAAEAIKNLKMGGEEWNYKVQGLHVLRRLARHHPDTFQNEILTYIRLTCVEVANLRSQVARLAIQIIGDYFTFLKTAMDTDIERTCECLLIKTGELNQFIRNDIITTLTKMVDNATPSRVLISLINHGTSHKSANVRAISAACFKDVVSRMGVNKCLCKELAPKFITALDKLSHDGNQEARYYGRLVLSWCMELSNFETLCQRHLPANSARNIRDLCDKIQNKGVGTLPHSGDRTSGRYRSQPVSRAQSNLSATYPSNRSRKASCHGEPADLHSNLEQNSPRVTRRPGPRRDLRETVHADRMPQSLYKNLNSSNWQDRYAGVAELLELAVKQTSDVRNCIVRISDAFTPRLKDPNSKVNLYALQCLLRMLPHLETSLDQVLTPFTEQLVPNLASQRANIVTLTSQILDGFRVHVDNPQLVCEYCRIIKSQNNPRIKPIILDKISDMVRDVHEVRPKLVEQMTVPIIIEHGDCLVQTNGVNNLGSYVGRLTCLLYQCMGNRLLTEIARIKPSTVGTVREYLVSNT